MTIADRLRELGLELPQKGAFGSYVPAVRTGHLLFVSGGGPQRPDGTFITGKVGADVDVETGQEAAKLCALYCLASVQEVMGDLESLERIVKVLGFVNSAPGFARQHIVMNGASDLLISVFGEAGRHARSAVGMAELPMNIAVEVELVAQVR
jgi:enamine deaminase RidA (YjgF/YER057c/UK114 family)